MAAQSPNLKLQKPPGYRDPNLPAHVIPMPPPRKPVHFTPTYSPGKKTNRTGCSCCLCCCCFFFFILIVLVVLALIGVLLFVFYQPQLPIFHLQSFQISRFNVTARSDGSYLDAKSTARVELKNPNTKMLVYYKDTRVEVTLGAGTGLGSDFIPGFTQGKKNTTSLKVETSVRNQLVGDGEGKKLQSSLESKELKVKVVARTVVGFIAERWRIWPVQVDIFCSSTLKSLQDGDMPLCTANIFKWIKMHNK